MSTSILMIKIINNHRIKKCKNSGNLYRPHVGIFNIGQSTSTKCQHCSEYSSKFKHE